MDNLYYVCKYKALIFILTALLERCDQINQNDSMKINIFDLSNNISLESNKSTGQVILPGDSAGLKRTQTFLRHISLTTYFTFTFAR